VVDAGAAVCIGGLLGLGACETAAEERADDRVAALLGL
jgi:hypothetical protein